MRHERPRATRARWWGAPQAADPPTPDPKNTKNPSLCWGKAFWTESGSLISVSKTIPPPFCGYLKSEKVPFWHIFRTIVSFSKLTKCCKLQHFFRFNVFCGSNAKSRKCCNYKYFLEKRCTKHCTDQCFWKQSKISFGGIPNSRNVLFLQIFLKRVAKPSAGNTSAGFPCTKRSQILLNPTWLCTKASQTFSGTSVEPALALHQSLPDLHRNLLRNPVKPDLALHRSLPDLPQNLLRNIVEPDMALHQSLPDLLRNLFRNLVEPDPSPAPGYSELKTPLAYAVGEKHCKLQHFWQVDRKKWWYLHVFLQFQENVEGTKHCK